MRDYFHHRGWHYLLLIAASVLLFFVNLGGATLWDLDEGRNATAALEMYASGNYVVPTFNGALRVDKPALLYWGQVIAYRLFGVNEFAARLPSALAALLTVLVVYELGRSMFTKGTGLLAGLIVASTPMLAGAARFANPDALLNLFVTATLALFWIGQHRPRIVWYVGVGAVAGLAVLAKGPIGLALPGCVILIYAIWTKQLRLLWQRGVVWGFLACALVALPWYLLVTAETKAAFLKGFLFNHNLDRFLQPMENHRGWPGFYVAVLLVGTAPWSIFAGLVGWYAARGAWSKPDGEQREPSGSADRNPYRFLVAWILVFIVFFSVAATKLPNYILPAAAPWCLLTARFLERWRLGQVRPPGWLLWLGLGSFALIGMATGAGLWIAGGELLPGLMRGRSFPELIPWAPLGILPVLGSLVAACLLWRDRRSGMIATLVLTTLLFIGPLAAFAGAAFNVVKGNRELVARAGACLPTEDVRVGCLDLEHLPSLNFYCRRDLVILQKEDEIAPFLEQRHRVILLLPAEIWARAQNQVTHPWHELARARELYHNADVVAVTNRTPAE